MTIRTPAAPAAPPALARRLGGWSATALVVGIVIGSGIFRSPASVAALVPHPLLMLGVWIAGGLVTLCGALSFAELAASLPNTGGIYVFLREGWGRLPAFLFGWSQLLVIRASALGGIAIVFGEYLLRSFGVDPVAHVMAARGVAAAAIAFAALINIRGVSLGAVVVNVSTSLKYAALAVLVLAAFALGGAHGATAAHLQAPAGTHVPFGAFGVALVAALWAYDGFADVSFAGGEVTDPGRNLPRAIIAGTLSIVVIYVLVNLAYVYVLPIGVMGRSPLVAADTMAAIFGRSGVALVSVFVMISTFSSLNGITLAAPRIFFAMADDGLFFRKMAAVHPRYRTPYIAIVLAALLGMALVMSRSFEAMTGMFVLAIWPFYALSVAALYRLRRTRPDLPRPYRVAGYPLVPAIFILVVVYFVANAFVQQPLSTVLTFGVILSGVPVYYLVFGRASGGRLTPQIELDGHGSR
ncbi:MAG: amino acid permease [Acidobacteriota bacterium]|nr:amino acid permease [Acidobacteriota bacterium]